MSAARRHNHGPVAAAASVQPTRRVVFEIVAATLGDMRYEEVGRRVYRRLRHERYDGETFAPSSETSVFDHIARFLKGLDEVVLRLVFREAVPAAAYAAYEAAVDLLVKVMKHAQSFIGDYRGTRDAIEEIMVQFKEPLADIVAEYFEDLRLHPDDAENARKRYAAALRVFLAHIKDLHDLRFNVKRAVRIILQRTDERMEDAFKQASATARKGGKPKVDVKLLRAKDRRDGVDSVDVVAY